MMRRRTLLAAASVGWPAAAALANSDPPAHREALVALRAGGCVVAMRHALAPGTFDPPEFRLGDCATQRNLSEAGRAQARRIGDWFKGQRLAPAVVLSSPWCRCVDTAMLAFGGARVWSALGSPHNSDASTNAARMPLLGERLAAAGGREGFEVWVTHMFVIAELSAANTASGEALVLRSAPGGRVEVLARLALA